MKKLLGSMVLFSGLLIALYAIVFHGFNQPLGIEQSQTYVIEPGASISSIANDLQDKQIISSARDLKMLAKLKDLGTVFAGKYEINPNMTLKEFYETITSSVPKADDVEVTIVEGWTLDQVAQALEEKGLVQKDEFVTAASTDLNRFAEEFPFVASIPKGQTLEGYLYPETYRFFADVTDDQVIVKFLSTFNDRFASKLADKAKTSEFSVHELVTLASIVEREVRSHEEMRTVAGLFYNRLEIDMALQADSTVGYITKSGRDRSTYEDLAIDSPYNTYKYRGLPPGPISNPGPSALAGVIDPISTEYFYFLTDEQGTVYYATDLAGHNRNRQLYLE